jgi:hypothetical protein
MKRSGFKRPERPPKAPVILRPATRRATYAGETAGPVPKDVKAKPGKGAPTVEEKRWLDAIVEHGCVCCWLDGSPGRCASVAVHHIVVGGRRLGHLYALPLGDPGHHQGGQPLGMVSRHPNKAAFEKKYGSEQSLLNGLQRKLGFPILSFSTATGASK